MGAALVDSYPRLLLLRLAAAPAATASGAAADRALFEYTRAGAAVVDCRSLREIERLFGTKAEGQLVPHSAGPLRPVMRIPHP